MGHWVRFTTKDSTDQVRMMLALFELGMPFQYVRNELLPREWWYYFAVEGYANAHEARQEFKRRGIEYLVDR